MKTFTSYCNRRKIENEKVPPMSNAHDHFYADYDRDTRCWGVFGTESGHCYALFSSEEEAVEEAVKRMEHKRQRETKARELLYLNQGCREVDVSRVSI